MGRLNDYPWKHNCPNKRAFWPCLVMSRPASDHRIYVCGTEEFILSDFSTREYSPTLEHNLRTVSHAGCATPSTPCLNSYVLDISSGMTHIKWDCGREELMSYVDSSQYESETPLQEAERKLQEYKEMVDATRRRIEKLKKETRFGVEPTNGSMVKIEKWYNGFRGGSRYYYGAIRIDSKWYMTCSNGYQKTPMSWDELKTFIGDSKFWVAGSFKEAPAA